MTNDEPNVNDREAESDGDSDSLPDMSGMDLFVEPPGFRPPTPQGHIEHYEREPEHVQKGTPNSLELHMMAKHSLWGHRLWNAGVVMARHIDARKTLARDKCVLELGAAAAVPSLLALLNGARRVVVTDWPDPPILRAIEKTVRANCPEELGETGRARVVGYQWGKDLDDVIGALPAGSDGFDLILLADLIFNHTEHDHLLKVCADCLSRSNPDACVLVYFSSHVVKWRHKDLKFFELAPAYGFRCERVEQVKASAMFPDDVGDLEVRETVDCYRMWRDAGAGGKKERKDADGVKDVEA
ncbi:nicotinamide n-methyltransferase [Irineochytrium annulatum]|nr:nicotinamide n-methyltransferase [Irineochytrium annulatum]